MRDDPMSEHRSEESAAPNDSLRSELARLPEPAPPARLAAGVMTRVARVDEAREEAVLEQHMADARSSRMRGRLASVLGGAGLAAHVYVLVLSGWSLDPLGSRLGGRVSAALELSAADPASFVLAVSLLLFLGGLLAPLGSAPLSSA